MPGSNEYCEFLLDVTKNKNSVITTAICKCMHTNMANKSVNTRISKYADVPYDVSPKTCIIIGVFCMLLFFAAFH